METGTQVLRCGDTLGLGTGKCGVTIRHVPEEVIMTGWGVVAG